MKTYLKKIALFFSIWMILSSVSETMFYQVHITWEYYMFFIIYGLYGYLMISLIHYYKISSFAGLFIAASIFWFLIEGAFVWILYESIPFSFIWTSLAWHALISVLLFWYYFRKIMLWNSLKNKILYNSFLGILLWLWGTYSWSAIETEWGSEILFDWVLPWEYWAQIVIWYVIFVFGHMIYERTIHTIKNIQKKELHIVWWLTLISFLIGNAIIYFPFSLSLPFLILFCLYILRKDTIKSVGITEEIDTRKICSNEYFFTLFIPLFAGIIYFLFFTYKIEIEMNAIYFMTGGLISMYLFSKSVFQLFKK